ncbi:hypothetical protein BJV78DRAFT_1158947 [Lactifluus subvellereus]|nr:hypothetical protein BJV78DRAFT_1158947 [Lactifluus subvellereus]
MDWRKAQDMVITCNGAIYICGVESQDFSCAYKDLSAHCTLRVIGTILSLSPHCSPGTWHSPQQQSRTLPPAQKLGGHLYAKPDYDAAMQQYLKRLAKLCHPQAYSQPLMKLKDTAWLDGIKDGSSGVALRAVPTNCHN